MILNKTNGIQFSLTLSLLISCFLSACDPTPDPIDGDSGQFVETPEKYDVAPGIIDEASGLTESASIAGYLWTHQDSGQPSSLYLISKDAKSIKEYSIPGAANNDWEDMTSGPGPEAGVNYLYIADIGNNNSPITETNIIYRIPEISDVNASFSADQLSRIEFRYPDGPRDAETLLLDPDTKDLFIVSKETEQTGIYRLPYPQNTTEIITAERIGTVPTVSIATSGDVSVDGKEILVRTYLSVYYWKRNSGETVGQALTRNATRVLSVSLDPQGEAICFDRSLNGFYTLSEKGNATGATLNFYKRK